jgi:hypothetical protein
VHPADQHAPEGAKLIMKMSGPLDFTYSDIPAGWDGNEFPADPQLAGEHRGVSSRPIDPAGGQPDRTGKKWQRLWHDVVTGWTTWLVTAPPGWRGEGEARSVPGSSEWFLLSGDLRTRIHGDLVDLRAHDYACDPHRFEDGGAAESSTTGYVAIRWTRGPDPRP